MNPITKIAIILTFFAFLAIGVLGTLYLELGLD